jgi:hypothetical protein
MQETGANIGFIISKHGLQKGAKQYTRATNLEGLTYDRLQTRYFPIWWRRYFCGRVAEAADVVNAYVEPYKSARAPFLDKLSADKLARYKDLQNRYCAFGTLMWQMDIPSMAPGFNQGPGHPANTPSDIQAFKTLLVRLLNVNASTARCAEEEFRAVFFRPLLEEVCAKLKAIELTFNALFGRNIFGGPDVTGIVEPK